MRNLPYRNLFANKKESQPSRESKDTRRKGYVPSRRTNAPSRRTNVSRRKSYMPSRRTTIPCRRANAPSRKCYAPSQRTAVPSRIRPQRSGADKVSPPFTSLMGCSDFLKLSISSPALQVFQQGDIYGNRHTRGAPQATAQFTMTISERKGILGFAPQALARFTKTISARRGLLGFASQAPMQSTMTISARRTG